MTPYLPRILIKMQKNVVLSVESVVIILHKTALEVSEVYKMRQASDEIKKIEIRYLDLVHANMYSY